MRGSRKSKVGSSEPEVEIEEKIACPIFSFDS